MTSKADVLKSIDDSKTHLNEVLSQVTPDDALISGILNFVRSKYLILIIKDIDESLKITTEEDLKLGQFEKPKDETAEYLIDRVWGDFYHPVFKYYQAQHRALNESGGQQRRKVVEVRKLNDRFKKIDKQAKDFYYDLLKNVLTQHKIDFIIPNYFYQFLDFQIDENAIKISKNDNKTIVKLIYIAHKCMLYIGACSRYRTLLSKFLNPSDQEDYNSALEMYRNAELLLPALGETRNHLGMVYNDQDLKFSALYEFLRASLSRIPSSLGENNYKKLINSTSVIIDKLNRLRLESKPAKNTIFERSTIYFFALFGYYSLPSVWKRSEGILINGTKISSLEKDLFDLFNEIAHEGNDSFFFERIFITLIGSIKLNNNSKSVSPELSSLLKFTFKFITYLQAIFVELWYDNEEKSFKLLPLFRLIYSWIKVDKLALQYSNRNVEYLKLSALISNLIFSKFPTENFNQRPKRDQYFAEDVLVREFIALDRLLYDFNDKDLFENDYAPSKLIGTFENHNFNEESKLRSISVGSIIKRLLKSNSVGITFDSSVNQFSLENANNPIKKKKQVKKEAKKEIPLHRDIIKKENKKKEKKFKTEPIKTQPKNKKNNGLSIKNAYSDEDPSYQQVYSIDDEDKNISIVSSDSDSAIEVVHVPTEKDIEKLTIHNDILSNQQTFSAEDIEAKLTNKNPIVDSLVTNTFLPNNSNIWKSTQPTNSWGNENISSYPQYTQNIFTQSTIPNLSPINFENQNIYSSPQYSHFLPPLPPPQQQPQPQPQVLNSQATPEHNQSIYLQYLNHYQTPQQQYPQYYNHSNIQVPATQSPLNLQNSGQTKGQFQQ